MKKKTTLNELRKKVGYPKLKGYKAIDEKPRAYKAGIALGKNILEMMNLMYQNNTALNFLKGLVLVLLHELNKRLR